VIKQKRLENIKLTAVIENSDFYDRYLNIYFWKLMCIGYNSVV